MPELRDEFALSHLHIRGKMRARLRGLQLRDLVPLATGALGGIGGGTVQNRTAN